MKIATPDIDGIDRRRLLLRAASVASAVCVGMPARAADPAPATQSIHPRSPHVGINLAGIAYWTAEFPFADLMKHSAGWSARDARGAPAGTLALGADGYPAKLDAGQTAVTPVAWQETRYAPGAYVVRWEGDGELAFPGVAAPVVSRAPGRIVLDVRETRAALHVAIVRTNPADPVRNVRFLWPGTEATHPAQPFNPLFLERIGPFSTLRFVDWGAINGSSVARWAERARLDDLTWATPRGAPLEIMLDLANALQAEPWLCIPHLADDDFVSRFAALVEARLDPRLKATIEYSNEVWNTGFAQARWAMAESARLGLPAATGQPSAFYAERVSRVSALCDEAFGAAQRRRWRLVLAGQAAWTQFSRDALAWKDTAKRVDALAIAPYFQAKGAADPAQFEQSVRLTPDALIEQMLGSIRGEVRARLAENAKIAGQYKLPLIGYEGGPHDSSGYFPKDRQDAMVPVFDAAHRHPRMRAVYREYFDAWIAAGGGVLNQYNDIGRGSKWGFWGALDYVTQDPATAPKYLGLLDAIAAHPRR